MTREQEPQWSLRTWCGVALLIMTLQLGLIFFGSNKRRVVPVRPMAVNNLPRFALKKATQTVADDSEYLSFFDQALFAEAHLTGFSGPGWLQKTDVPYPLIRKAPEPVMLGAEEAQLLFRPGSSGAASNLNMALPPIKVMETPRFAISIPARQSTVEIEGLSARPMMGPLALPLQRQADVPNASVVQVAVDTDGLVRSARLLQSSGLKSADADALAVARKARFAKSPGGAGSAGDLEWGKLIFHWFALELTNAATAVR